MNQKEDKNLLMNGREATLPAVHAREVAAMIESVRYTDRSAREWGFPDIFSLAEHLFARLKQGPAPEKRDSQKGGRLSLWAVFFSSRRRHTRFDCDWSSDVCSSDLVMRAPSWTAASAAIRPLIAAEPMLRAPRPAIVSESTFTAGCCVAATNAMSRS